jgi:predicted Zn-dependent protease
VVLEAPSLETKKEELLDVKRGILFKDTGDRPNLANGEFSGLMSSAFLIENGEVTRGLKETGFGINLLDFLKRIDLLGDDRRQVGPIISPSCRVIGMRIAGK